MKAKLFLDDERFPPAGGEDWVVVRSVPEAIAYMETFGCPTFISFDHDLAQEQDGKDLANWMVEHDLDWDGRFMPADFSFYVHSQNSVGGPNIEKLLRPYLAMRAASGWAEG